jgi:uncharacterized protein (TIGR00266 family)
MRIEVKHGPSGTAALCHLSTNEKLTSEGGALMAMSTNVEMNTSTRSRNKSGVFTGLKRMLSGESFFLNHFTARSEASIWLSTPLPGDIMVHELKGDGLIVSGGSYIASTDEVQIDLQFQGMKGLFTGENLFWIRAQGTGPLILGSFGQIYPVEIDGEYIVDTGHIVAFQETLDFSISKVGSSWIHSFLGGEGLICRFKGRGTVWCQSHSPGSFGAELTPHLRPRQN